MKTKFENEEEINEIIHIIEHTSGIEVADALSI
jgi:hypothetical protein